VATLTHTTRKCEWALRTKCWGEGSPSSFQFLPTETCLASRLVRAPLQHTHALRKGREKEGGDVGVNNDENQNQKCEEIEERKTTVLCWIFFRHAHTYNRHQQQQMYTSNTNQRSHATQLTHTPNTQCYFSFLFTGLKKVHLRTRVLARNGHP